MARLFSVTTLLVAITTAILFTKQNSLTAHHLSFIPPAMEVSDVLYVAEEAWGLGPGGNETGIIVYEMPQSTREKIEQAGVSWLDGLSGSGTDWHGRYATWHMTPFDPTVQGAFDIWAMDSSLESCGHGGGIASYMFRYGFCIPFDPEIENIANEALSSPSNFYAFGRIGMLLLIPDKNRIIYAYNG